MTGRIARLIVAVASLGVAAAIGTLPAAATAAKPTHVGIVIRFSTTSTLTACVSEGGDGLDVLVRGFPNTDIPTSGPYAGFVVSIDGTGQNPPDDTHYWSYWHASADGWKYSSTGGSTYTPKAGAVEGWSYVDGQDNAPKPPTYSYQKLCGGKDPAPSPSTTQAASPTHPATHPSPRPTHSSTRTHAPGHHAASSRPHTRTQPPTPASSDVTPTSSAATHTAPAHPTTSHAAAAQRTRHGSGSQTGPIATTDPASPAPTDSTVAASAPSPTLSAVAGSESKSGFPAAPAVGTLLAVLVIAALGGAAWLRLRRRPE
jgi:hypothetical protein